MDPVHGPLNKKTAILRQDGSSFLGYPWGRDPLPRVQTASRALAQQTQKVPVAQRETINNGFDLCKLQDQLWEHEAKSASNCQYVRVSAGDY